MLSNFAITRLSIRADKKWNGNVLRTLHQGEEYVFNSYADKEQSLCRDFFGVGVSVSAIVGKNGSGKSSLLDLIYRMLNNLGYCLKNCLKQKPQSPNLGFVPNVYADLDYVVMNPQTEERTRCCLHNDGNIVALEYGEEKYVFNPTNDYNNGRKYAGYERIENVSRTRLGKLSHCLFYTIVVNYSLQAFLPDEYEKDGTVWPEGRKNKKVENGIWIDEVFHKNDGYMTPIVLNPYRDYGTIDMNNIDGLVDNYVLSLLVYYKRHKRNNEFVSGYKTGRITYTENAEEFIDKCRQHSEAKNNQEFMANFRSSVNGKLSYSYYIIRAYGFDAEASSVTIWHLYLYLVYKTLSIASKYSDYEEFREIGNLRNCTRKDAEVYTCAKCGELVEAILEDCSHITFKIRQACYLVACLKAAGKDSELDKMLFSGSFELERYQELTAQAWERVPLKDRNKLIDSKALHLEAIIQILPPPIYSFQISLTKKDGAEVNFRQLSSGERQFIHTISTVVYHINNILSIDTKTRIRYRKINIVLDEAELCAHPEMQRQFLSILLKYISGVGLTWNCSYNIIIVTHSPFILSDIPQCNILYLEEGKQIDRKRIEVNPFGANVNDVLAQSFFLSNGFVGEFAKKKIESLVKYLKGGTKTKCGWDDEKARCFINDIVGEPVIKMMLKGMLDEKDFRR